MNIVIAADKFKGSLTAFEVTDRIRRGLLRASGRMAVTELPLSDGGDGLASVFRQYRSGQVRSATVADPLFRPVPADWLLSEDGTTAVVEMAAASGLQLLSEGERNAVRTSSFGTGQLIRESVSAGARKIILGIGGSATNDGGIGMAAALGYRFLDRNGKELPPVGASLGALYAIDARSRIPLSGIEVMVASDVTNPLLGPEGATRVYGPQKGLNEEEVEAMERGMEHYTTILARDLGIDVCGLEGGGAAGGTGAGCVAFLQASLVSGTGLALEWSRAEEHMGAADWVLTGEGRLDSQTGSGKLVGGVAALAGRLGKPVVALCGAVDADPEDLDRLGFTAAFSLAKGPVTLNDACRNAGALLEDLAYQIGKIIITRT
ncbi:MAG TPA: glycerate kinase [Chitinophagaceae bacterium]|jgi:glycerate kinase|nr:glycerate kinase [Chitinophagaceae bacterium]